jgi:4a-hydroxytetrahydrobiopterin dehydratase
MQAFSVEETQQHLDKLTGWQIENGQLTKTFRLDTFVGALNFVNRVGELAERAGHHPDIDIRYNRVRLNLSTHDAGGLTAKDFDLASQVCVHVKIFVSATNNFQNCGASCFGPNQGE